jgi:hypothetical protein
MKRATKYFDVGSRMFRQITLCMMAKMAINLVVEKLPHLHLLMDTDQTRVLGSPEVKQ